MVQHLMIIFTVGKNKKNKIMHYILYTKLIKQTNGKNETLKVSTFTHDTNTDLTVGQIKQICSDNFNKNLNRLTKVKDEFWVYNKEMKDDSVIISSTNGLEYDLFVQ